MDVMFNSLPRETVDGDSLMTYIMIMTMTTRQVFSTANLIAFTLVLLYSINEFLIIQVHFSF
jgi:hypothetical protein